MASRTIIPSYFVPQNGWYPVGVAAGVLMLGGPASG